MKALICSLVLGIAVSLGSTVAMSRPAAAAALPASLSALVGSWSCVYTGPKGTAKSTYTISQMNDLWIQGTGESGAYGGRPASKSFFFFGYDPKKHVFINMGGSSNPGDYGSSTADAAASAMTMTYTNIWPADPTHEHDVWHFAPSGITIASSWTEKGKAMSGKGSCTKQ
ncbi:MAG TPA: hypothetical protein VIX83_08870 [Candidatus Cybelea sp.]